MYNAALLYFCISYYSIFADEDIHDRLYGTSGRYYSHDSYIAFVNRHKFKGKVRFDDWDVEDMIDVSGVEPPFYTRMYQPHKRYEQSFNTILMSNENIQKIHLKERLLDEKKDKLSLKYQEYFNEQKPFISFTDQYLNILLLDKSLMFSKARFTQSKLEFNRDVMDSILVHQAGTDYMEFKHREYHLLKLRHTCDMRNWLIIDTLVLRGIYASGEYDYQLWWSTMLFTGERVLPWSYIFPSTESKKRYLTSEFVAKEYKTQMFLIIDAKLRGIERWLKIYR